jgi:hypothetical protein
LKTKDLPNTLSFFFSFLVPKLQAVCSVAPPPFQIFLQIHIAKFKPLKHSLLSFLSFIQNVTAVAGVPTDTLTHALTTAVPKDSQNLGSITPNPTTYLQTSFRQKKVSPYMFESLIWAFLLCQV